YQIVDDILDATTPSKVLGKTTGKDARFAKPTFVTVLGLAVAKEQAAHLRTRALDLLHNMEIDHPLLFDLTQFILPSHFGQT
ncbi:MAG: polyprenyl synthetase family protein, partial [Methylophilaceae bacterium]|nr:polyprenyl synthetase family protein [Methylophilaceae bacterium]